MSPLDQLLSVHHVPDRIAPRLPLSQLWFTLMHRSEFFNLAVLQSSIRLVFLKKMNAQATEVYFLNQAPNTPE